MLVIKRLGATKNPVPDDPVFSASGEGTLGGSRTHFTTALIAAALSFMSREVNKRSFSSKSSNDFASAILFIKSIDAPATSEVLSSDKEKGPRQALVLSSFKSCRRFFNIHAFHSGLEIESTHPCPPF